MLKNTGTIPKSPSGTHTFGKAFTDVNTTYGGLIGQVSVGFSYYYAYAGFAGQQGIGDPGGYEREARYARTEWTTTTLKCPGVSITLAPYTYNVIGW